MGAFPPPVPNAGDTCYISDHIDIAIGLNAARRTPRRRSSSSTGSAPPSSPRSTPTRCRASSRCQTAAGDAREPAGAGVRLLARDVRVDDPLDLPDPVARHPEPRERDLERLGQRDPRHRDPGPQGSPGKTRAWPPPLGGPLTQIRRPSTLVQAPHRAPPPRTPSARGGQSRRPSRRRGLDASPGQPGCTTRCSSAPEGAARGADLRSRSRRRPQRTRRPRAGSGRGRQGLAAWALMPDRVTPA